MLLQVRPSLVNVPQALNASFAPLRPLSFVFDWTFRENWCQIVVEDSGQGKSHGSR